MTDPAQYISGRTVQEQMNSLIDYVDARAAEVATDAIASDVAQVHQDMLDADADAAAAAASAAAAAGTLANAVKKTGEASQSIAGDIAVSGKVTSGATPSGNTDLTTKKYVDDQDALKISITDINNYAVGLTGNQNLSGNKILTKSANNANSNLTPAGYVEKIGNVTVNVTAANRYFYLACAQDADNNILAAISIRYSDAGNVFFNLETTDADGNRTSKTIATFVRSTGTWS